MLMIEREEGISHKRPVLIVPFSIIFGSVNLQGDSIISEEVYDIMVKLRKQGYYIVIDSHIPLCVAVRSLSDMGIPYDGLMFDKDKGMLHDEERYAERVEYHCGWGAVSVVIDEDILRLKLAVELGAVAIQIQSGCIISHTSTGRKRVKVPSYAEAYPASASVSHV